MIEFIASNWGEVMIAAMAFAKVIVNLTPTEKDNAIFAKLDNVINFFIKDKLK